MISTIAHDITERLRYQQQLRHLADHDALTGARNRRRFEQELSTQIGRCRRFGERAALLILDLDNLKEITDEHGHRAGDAALKAVAGALKRRLRESDTFARIGGDEFAILLPYADLDQAGVLARAVGGGGGVLDPHRRRAAGLEHRRVADRRRGRQRQCLRPRRPRHVPRQGRAPAAPRVAARHGADRRRRSRNRPSARPVRGPSVL